MSKKLKKKTKTRKSTGIEPKISVIIYSYNFEDYLEECIESIISQTLKPYEIIIADDHSTDSSWDIIQRYAKKYPGWIRAFRHESNLGNVNNGLFARSKVSGNMQSEIDGDDKWLPEKLEWEWRTLQKNPEARAAYSNVFVVDQSGNTIRKYVEEGDEAPEGDVFIYAFAKRFFKNTRSLFRNELIYRDTYLESPRDLQMGIHSDWDMKIRLTARYPVAYSGKALVVYRDHPGGIHHQQRKALYDSAKRVVHKNLFLLQKRTAAEKQFVLQNVRQLLEHLAGLEGMDKKEEIDALQAPVTPVVVNSLPKAGTNLVTKALRLTPGLWESGWHLGHSTVQHTEVAGGREAVAVGIDMPRLVKKEAVEQTLQAVPDNHFVSAHLPWSKALAASIKKSGLKMLLVLRDPRDVAVSHARYIADTPDHPLHKHYAKLSPEERLMTSITGCEADGVRLESIGKRCASVLPWLKEPFVQTVRFEDLVGPQGGGAADRQRRCLKEMFEFIGTPFDDAVLYKISDRLFGGTGTFRKGQSGGWKTAFNDRHLKAFMQSAGKYLKPMGYAEEEQTNNIQSIKGNATVENTYQGENLIFLISQPRAGSTLVQRILAGHSQIFSTAEPWIMLHPLYALKKEGLQSEFSFRDAVIGMEDFTAQLPKGEETYVEALRLMAGHLYNSALQKAGKSRFLDKTPRYYFIINELQRVFPQARFVFLWRNPLAVLSSILDTWVKNDWPRLGLHRSDLLQAPQMLLEGVKKTEGQSAVLHYEELAAHPQKQIQQLCRQLNLEFEPDMLNYGSLPAPQGRMGDAVGVKKHQSAVTDSIDKWKQNMRALPARLLADVYLTLLGEETVQNMGYDYFELDRYLNSIDQSGGKLSREEAMRALTPLGLTKEALDRVEPVLYKYVDLNTAPAAATPSARKSKTPQAHTYLASAIVSTYNSEKFIRGCLQSLVDQTLYQRGRLEIIVIDSHSPQNEKAIVEEFQQKYDHIRYVRTEQRETIYRAWNRGIRLARGKYVTNANTDDRLRRDAIEKLVTLLEEHPDKVLAYGNSLVTKTPNETFEKNSAIDAFDWPDFRRETMLSFCYMGPHPVWRKSLHDEIGYFDESLTSAADWEFWLRAAVEHDFIHLNEYVGLYYLDDSTVSRRGNTPIIEANQVRAKYKPAYKKLLPEIIFPENMHFTKADEKNLLIVAHNFPPFRYSGTENYVYDYAKEMQRQGWTVHVLYPHVDIGQAAPELRFHNYQGVPVLEIWHDGSEYVHYLDVKGEKLLRIVEEILKYNHYQAVHYHHFLGLPFELFHLFKKNGLHVSVTLHDFTLLCFRSHLYINETKSLCSGPEANKCTACLRNLLGNYFPADKEAGIIEANREKWHKALHILKHSDTITAPSRYVADTFRKLSGLKNLAVEVQPLGLKAIQAAPKPVDPQNISFAYLGTITPLKNISALLEAFSATKGTAMLDVWGSGDADQIRLVLETAKKDQRIRYHGRYRPEDIPSILSRADMVVVPSFTESYSLVVREAMMCGRPVIAADVGAIPEIIRHDQNGLLFNPKEVDSLRQNIQKVLDQPRLIDRYRQNLPAIRTIEEDARYWAGVFNTATSEKDGDTSQPAASPIDRKKRLPRIGYLALEPSAFACPQIRLYGPLSLLAEQGKIEFIDFKLVEAKNYELDVKALRGLDILIIQRNFAETVSFDQLVQLLGDNRPKIVYEFDDAFDRLPEHHPGYAYYEKMKPRFREYIRKADLVTVSTETLAEYYRSLNSRIKVLPNTVNEQVWKKVKPKFSANSKPARILFAGTIGHEADLEEIRAAVAEILDEYGDRVELLLWGNRLPELEKRPNVKQFTEFRVRYPEYAAILQETPVDFALVPLAEHPFNRAKSHIKWLEYGACAIPGIFSRVPAYEKVVEHKKTGLLCRNKAEEWKEAIRFMLEQPKKRQQIARSVWKKVWNEHTLSRHIRLWEEAYNQLLADEEASKRDDTRVSIIIPVFNKLEYTRRCIDSIYKNSGEIDFEIIVVDNASTDGTAAYLAGLRKEKGNVRVISNRENAGFAAANNQAARIARGKYLLFLNNDTEVHKGWLKALVVTAESNAKTGAVGAKLLYPDGTLQHAGVLIVDNGVQGDPLLAVHNHYHQPGDLPEANQLREYQALTAACLLVNRQAFEEVGRFDEGFWNGYEDVDLCFTLREKGYKIIYQPACVVTHYESKSGRERFSRVKENIERLHEKWLGKIQPDAVMEAEPAAPKETGSRQTEGKLVSIIMLTYNALDYTKKCVDSILKHTTHPYEIVFVDNASTDGTKKYLRGLTQKHKHIKVLFNKKNRGFAAANNQAVRKAKGDYVMILNNDVLVADGWLKGLVKALEADEKIGMVGPLTNKISGLQMVADVPYSDEQGFYEYARTFRRQYGGNITPRRRIAGFAMLMKKNLYQQVGGFDESYGTGNYEDDDLCLKVRRAGYAIMVDEGTFIHHYGSQTFKANRIDILQSLDEKGKVFKQKWPDVDYEELLEMKNPLTQAHEKRIEQAARQMSEGNLREALDGFDQVLQENPLSAQALLGRAMCLRGLGQAESALEAVQKFMKWQPQNAAGRNLYGILLSESGRKEEALEQFTRAVESDPAYIEVQRNYAQTLVDLEDYGNGIKAYVRILENHPDDVPSLTAMAMFNYETGRLEEAATYWERANEVQPDHPDVRALAELLNKAASAADENKASDEPAASIEQDDYAALMEQANRLLSDGNPVEAEQIYRALLEQNNEDLAAFYGLGLCMRLAERYDDAKTIFSAIVDEQPDFVPAYTNLGTLALLQGNLEEALHWFSKAVELDADNLEAKQYLSDVLIELGQYQQGVEIIMQAFKDHPEDVMTLLRVGKLHYEAGKRDDSRRYFETVLKLEPENDLAASYLQQLNQEQGAVNV
ncbi:MAG TPA: glycosyltransferase [Caldithrix abyssi]|uniref:Glycosyltransferase n=1 Tax=Caldithrix abyssi TaxID=187145 RepID=A0A7V4WU18_CALAY|nr:glycosyltransferase [Caldithrix abyssi]